MSWTRTSFSLQTYRNQHSGKEEEEEEKEQCEAGEEEEEDITIDQWEVCEEKKGGPGDV